jgi:hypothetical protein
MLSLMLHGPGRAKGLEAAAGRVSQGMLLDRYALVIRQIPSSFYANLVDELSVTPSKLESIQRFDFGGGR